MNLPLAQQAPEGFVDKNRDLEGCVAQRGFCPDWIADNYDRYIDPFGEHVVLTLLPVVIGFAIAFTLAVVAHRRRWLIGPFGAITGALYTVPSIALLFILAPLTGLGARTAVIALTCYTLLILFRNVTTGLDAVPDDAKDAARGMGLTDRQLLTKVELPLALPEILAGLRIAVATTVGLAAFAFLIDGGGLGAELYRNRFFKSNVVVAGGLCVLLAAVLDVVILTAQRLLTPWRRAAA